MLQWTVVWKNVTRRRTRSLLTIGGMSVAVAAVVALMGVADRCEQSFFELYERRGADLVVQRAGGAVQLSSGLDASLGDRIRRLPHVRQVIGSLMDMIAFPQSDLFAVLVNGWPADSPVLGEVTTIAGRRLRSGDRGKLMLGKTLAMNLGKQAGDQVEFYGEPFEVTGVFDSFSVYESGGVFVLLDELQRLMDRPHQVTGYVIEVDKLTNQTVADVQREITALEPGLAVVGTGEFVRGLAQIQVVRAMAWVTSLVAFIVGAIGISNTMLMAVFERRADIGTLRALGWSTPRVIRLILSESLILSLLGASGGSLLGALIVRSLAYLPVTAGLIDGRLGGSVVGLGYLLAITVGLCGAAYPAWWAARLTPMMALRQH